MTNILFYRRSIRNHRLRNGSAQNFGPGFLEGVYCDALAVELSGKGIPYERERRVPVAYKGVRLTREYIADLVCRLTIMVELKAVDILSGKEEVQLLNYLNATGRRIGLPVNIGSIGKLEWKRMIK